MTDGLELGDVADGLRARRRSSSSGRSRPSPRTSASRSQSSGKTSAGQYASTVALDDLLDEPDRLVLQVASLEDLAPLAVDRLALGVHDVVVLQDVLAPLVVQLLDLLLRVLDGAADHLRLDRLVVGPLQPLHDRRDPVAREHPHQVVLEREVEERLAGVALAARPAAELVVDAPGLVPLGPQDVQPAQPDDLLVLGVGLGLELRVDRLVLGLVGGALLVVHLEQQVRVVVPVARRHLHGARGTRRCRRAGCRRRGRPCSWRP